MKGEDIDMYIATFQNLITKAGYNPNEATTLEIFQDRLPNQLVINAIHFQHPVNWEQWKAAACLQQAEYLILKDHLGKNKPSHNRKGGHSREQWVQALNRTRDPNAMDPSFRRRDDVLDAVLKGTSRITAHKKACAWLQPALPWLSRYAKWMLTYDDDLVTSHILSNEEQADVQIAVMKAQSQEIGTRDVTHPIRIWNVDSTHNQDGAITQYTDLTVRTGKEERTLRFLVTNLGRDEVILGYPWFTAFEPSIKWGDATLNEEFQPVVVSSLHLSDEATPMEASIRALEMYELDEEAWEQLIDDESGRNYNCNIDARGLPTREQWGRIDGQPEEEPSTSEPRTPAPSETSGEEETSNAGDESEIEDVVQTAESLRINEPETIHVHSPAAMATATVTQEDLAAKEVRRITEEAEAYLRPINPTTGHRMTADDVAIFRAVGPDMPDPPPGAGGPAPPRRPGGSFGQGPPNPPGGGRGGRPPQFGGGGGGNPFGGGPPPPPGGPQPAGPPLGLPHGAERLAGETPTIFDGNRKEYESFLTQWHIYWGQNAEAPIMLNVYRRCLLFLGFVKGPQVANWTLGFLQWLNNELRLGRSRYDDFLWDTLTAGFSDRFSNVLEQEEAQATLAKGFKMIGDDIDSQEPVTARRAEATPEEQAKGWMDTIRGASDKVKDLIFKDLWTQEGFQDA
ncbi:hypothetical protein EDB83DRAFT_2534102 [Lactarius deliciosus]|nr:hypothetical protein EDB83DRAFT_2534102 [Lactarius deliciosus]